MANSSLFVVLSVPEAGWLEHAEILLKWEAHKRGMTVGWALYSLLNEAADIEGYPRRVRTRLMALRKVADRQCSKASERRYGGRTKPTSAEPVAGRGSTYRVQFATPECYRVVRGILAYEAVLRGLTRSQAACDLIERAAKPWSYPKEVRERLDKVDRKMTLRAIDLSMQEASGSPSDDEPGRRVRLV